MDHDYIITLDCVWVLVFHQLFGGNSVIRSLKTSQTKKKKVIIDDTMIFSTHKEHFEDLDNL